MPTATPFTASLGTHSATPDQTARAASLRAQSQLQGGKLPMLMSLVLGRVRTWLVYRETVRELESLDDRELTDLGIGRDDIRCIARQAARLRSAQ
jgi:uncharacterized protein YjiS (DUF1127 family)